MSTRTARLRSQRQEQWLAQDCERRISLREHRIAFDVVQNVGVQRLSDAEKVQSGTRALAHINRTARKTVEMISSVDYEQLDSESKIAHNARVSMFGALAAISKPKVVKRLEGEAVKSQRVIGLKETLELCS